MAKQQRRPWSDYRGGRLARFAQLLMTRYVDRFHPAAMVADFLDKPDVLEAFRLINGVPGIAEAVIRWYGPIRASRDGFTKSPDCSGPTPTEIVNPLRAAKAGEQRMALRYLVYTLESGRTGPAWRHLESPLVNAALSDDDEAVLRWGVRTPWVRKFAEEWRVFCQAMLAFYKDMRYIDQEDISRNKLIQGPHLIRALRNDLGALDHSPIRNVDDSNVADSLLGSLARNIYGAVRANALFTLWHRALGSGGEILQEDEFVAQDATDQRFELVRFHDSEIRRARAYRAKDDLVQLMIQSLYREPPGRLLAFMIAVKNVMAALITADPAFVLRNSTRDTLSAFVLGRAWMVPVADTLRGAAAFSVASDDARQWFLQGGHGVRSWRPPLMTLHTRRAYDAIARRGEQIPAVRARLPQDVQHPYRTGARSRGRHARHAVPPHAQPRVYAPSSRLGFTRCCHGLRQSGRR